MRDKVSRKNHACLGESIAVRGDLEWQGESDDVSKKTNCVRRRTPLKARC